MVTTTEIVRRFAAGSHGGEAPVLLIATDKQDDRLVDPVIWGDEERMKRELMAWAKAVASMALNGSVGSTTPHRGSMGQMGQYSGSRLQRTS
jgi:hypothetical protein